jgi:hypothetical protein
MPVRAVPGLTGKQWRRHPVIMPRAARFNQNAGMAGPGFPVPLTAWNRMGADLCPDTQAGRGPSCSVLLTSTCLRGSDLAPAGLRAGDAGDGDLGLTGRSARRHRPGLGQEGGGLIRLARSCTPDKYGAAICLERTPFASGSVRSSHWMRAVVLPPC